MIKIDDLFEQPYEHARWLKDEAILADRLLQSNNENMIELGKSVKDFANSKIAAVPYIEYILYKIKQEFMK